MVLFLIRQCCQEAGCEEGCCEEACREEGRAASPQGRCCTCGCRNPGELISYRIPALGRRMPGMRRPRCFWTMNDVFPNAPAAGA